jgi:hypothetical protein
MNSILQEQVGKKVSVYSNQPGAERQDVGILEGYDDHFVKVRKSESEVIYFGIAQIRLIKPFYQ